MKESVFELRRTVAIGMGILLAGVSSAAAESLYGIHWWGWNGHAFDSAPAELLDTQHARGWTLETIITHSGAFWWEAPFFTGLYSGLAQHNARALTRIDYNWGQTVPAPTTVSATVWANHVVTDVVDPLRHGGNIWQIGNEPNLVHEGNGWVDNQITPSAYAGIYRAVRDAIRADAETSPWGPHQVLVAPPSPGGIITGVRWMAGNVWLAQTLAAIPNDEIDGVAIHAYGDRNLPVATSLREFRRTFAEQMAVLRGLGLSHVPVYMTEFGQESTSAAEEAKAAEFLRGAYAVLNRWNQVPGNQNIVSANWFVYDGDDQAGGGWNNWSLEYWRDNGNALASRDNLFTAFREAVAERYAAGVAGSTPLPPGVRVFDDFEGGSGRFGSSLNASTYSRGFISATVTRGAEESYTNSFAQTLTIRDDPADGIPWRLRHLSGGGQPNNNVPLPVTNGRDGFVGLLLRTHTPGLSVRLLLDTTNPPSTSGLRTGHPRQIVGDGHWHLYQWSLDAGQWSPFPGANGSVGELPEGHGWINSLLIEGVNADAVIDFDTVMHRPDGSLLPMGGLTGSYPEWAAYYEGIHGVAAGTLADRSGDPDGDGMAGLLEYAFESLGTDPLAPDLPVLPRPVLSGGELVLLYPQDLEKADVTVRAVISSDLVTWHAPGDAGAPSDFADIVFAAGAPIETRRASIPVAAGERYFLRLEVVSEP